MKKILAALLAFALLLPGAALAETANAGYPCVDEPLTLTAFATAGPYTKGDFNDLAMWDVMEELTNITFEFEAAPSGQSAERLGLLFASNTLPDVIFKTGLSTTDVSNYAEEGQLVAIDPYLEEYAPNFSALLETYPEVRKAITMPDGHIYGFPYVVTASPSNCTPKLFINQKVLDAFGAEEPRTLDELTELLRRFKESDWNGNGQADEIPMTMEGFGQVLTGLYGTFGLGTRGASSTSWDIDPETGALRFIPASEGYREWLEYVAMLYQEGLLDEEIFTSDIAAYTAKAEQNILFFAPATNTNYLSTYQDDFVGLSAPLTRAEGEEPFWAGENLAVYANNTFITNQCENPAAVVKYFDYFYGEEGITLFFMGIEGETFYYDEDGNPQYTDFVKNNPDGMNMEEALGTYVCWSGGGNPSVADDLHFGVHLIPEATVTAAQNLLAYGPETIWPADFSYTTEEAELLAEYKLEILTYVEDMRARFITGSESLENWDAYLEQLDRMDLEGYTELVQTALDRYNAE